MYVASDDEELELLSPVPPAPPRLLLVERELISMAPPEEILLNF
jgi:hypothetical protein